VTLAAGPEKLRALMRGQPRIDVDTDVALSCDPRKMHFFRPDGQALAPAETGA
jgi:multiple sugar transport system ATP-binding protein